MSSETINEEIEQLEMNKDTRASLRIQELIRRNKELESTLASVKESEAKANKKYEDFKTNYEKEVKELHKDFNQKQLDMEIKSNLTALGIQDPDVIEFAKHKYSAIETDETTGKKKDFNVFLEENKDSKWLKSFMPTTVQKEEESVADAVVNTTADLRAKLFGQKKTDVTTEKVTASTSAAKPNAGLIDAKSISSLTPAQWKENKATILANLKNKKIDQ